MERMATDVPALSRAQLRELDRIAVEELSIPSCILMENAGRGAADLVRALFDDARSGGPSRARASGAQARRVAIFCGPGNNGGDGGVVARHLANAGLRVDVYCTEPAGSLHGDAALERRIVERMGLPVHDVSSAPALAAARDALESADVLVDGLLGTGFHGEVRPKIARVIDAIAGLRARGGATVVALDLPSGLDCDRGEPASPTVVADLTATFAAPKTGFDRPAARAVLGRVEIVSIGTPPALVERVRRG